MSLSTLDRLLLALSISLTSMSHYHEVRDERPYDFSETLILSCLYTCTIWVWWWRMTGWRNWIAWHYNGGDRWDVMLDTRMTNQKQICILYFKTVDQKEVNAMMAVSIVYAAKWLKTECSEEINGRNWVSWKLASIMGFRIDLASKVTRPGLTINNSVPTGHGRPRWI